MENDIRLVSIREYAEDQPHGFQKWLAIRANVSPGTVKRAVRHGLPVSDAVVEKLMPFLQNASMRVDETSLFKGWKKYEESRPAAS